MKANLLRHYGNLPLLKRLLIIVSIPCLSYLVVSIIEITREWRTYQKAMLVEFNNSGVRAVSALIREVQIERGTSAVFLKSEGSMPISKVKAKRKNTDQKLPQVRTFIREYLDVDQVKLVQDSLDSLTALRASVEKSGNVGAVVSGYTEVVHTLINFQKSTANIAPAEISSKIRSLLLLESARENAGLLRANLSGMLAIDMPISDEQFQKLLRFKAGIDSNLSSSALDLSQSGFDAVTQNYEKEHWQQVDNVFKTVLTLANEGGFGEDGQEFFATMTKVVDDVGALVKDELDYIDKTTSSVKSVALSHLMLVIFGILINIIIIATVLLYSIKQIISQLSELMGKMKKSTKSVSEASDELANTSQNLASGSQETAAALQETVSSMSEMNSMVSRTKEKSEETKQASESIANRVDKANVTIEELMQSMSALSESNEQLDKVNKVIRSISKQTKVIDDIVFKTQLLAVNASIEAAKAGAHGKGFAVVADEVSKLAQMSGESSEKITSLLDESEDQVNQIIKDVSKRVNRGSETAGSVKGVFSEISQEVNQIKLLSDDMDQASEEQSLGIEQVTGAVAQIDEATQINTAEAQVVEEHSAHLSKESVHLQVIGNDLMTTILGRTVDDEASSSSDREALSSDDTSLPKASHVEESDTDHRDRSLATVDPDDDDDLANDGSFRPAS